MAYKQIFSQAFDKLPHDLEAAVTLRDGVLHVMTGDGAQDVAVGEQHLAGASSLLRLRGSVTSQPGSGQYGVAVVAQTGGGPAIEFWLESRTKHSTRRVKLSAEGASSTSTPRGAPRVALFGPYSVVDDGGIVRLFETQTLDPCGAFQLAQPGTDNQIVALAGTQDGAFLAGLSRWKNIVLYDVRTAQVMLARQVRDGYGWYEGDSGFIGLSAGAAVLFVVGHCVQEGIPKHVVTVFRQVE